MTYAAAITHNIGKARTVATAVLLLSSSLRGTQQKQMQTTSTTAACISQAEKQAFLDRLKLSPERIKYYQTIDQRSQEWHDVKLNRIGGSMMGAIAHHDPMYSSPTSACMSMLWGGIKSTWQMEKGTIMEPAAFITARIMIRNQLLKEGYENAWIESVGILVWDKYPFFAVSTDGEVYATGHPTKPNGKIGTIEIKAPSGDKHYPEVLTHQVDEHDIKIRCQTKDAHYDQFMGTAAVHGVKRIWYVTYTSHSTLVQEYEFDENYWNNHLFPCLYKWYMDAYLPRAILKERGILENGKTDPPDGYSVPPIPDGVDREKEEDRTESLKRALDIIDPEKSYAKYLKTAPAPSARRRNAICLQTINPE